jgi:F-type H+-transporting ATPase subunit epsilon
MVVARGTEGEVGILTGHAPMLIRLAIGALRIHMQDSAEAAVVDGGFLHVTSGEGGTRVDVLATHAEMAGEIDLRAAQVRVEELRRRLEEHRDVEAEADLAKALARVHLAGSP